MNKRLWAEWLLVAGLLLVITGLLAYSGADLDFSAQFYRNGGWPVGEQFPWKFLYRLDRIPAIGLALFALIMAVRGYYSQPMRHWVRPGIFLVLLLALGPGLLVNTLFKDHWGRPRPREVVQFGGVRQFQQPWQPGISGKGRSFPSGHSSAAFYLCAPYFIYRSRKPLAARAWLLGGAVFGIAMSYARIAQGGHFLTDTLWSFGMVWLLALVMAAIILRDDVRIPAKG